MKVIYNEKYKDLFAAAEQELVDAKITDDKGNKIVIDDLATYYAVLDKLEQVGGPYYLRALPLDEDCFEINTNTREIVIPDEIDSKKWVIGVRDDHLAEVLWFHVDRYFDGQDLAICFPMEDRPEGVTGYGQTYVQWKNAKGQGLDPVQHVQISEEHIYFGWYMRSNNGVLNASGDLTFSVRFQYHKAGKDNEPDLTSEVLFSFNTLPVTCKVLSNLIETMGSNVTSIADLTIENTITQGMVRPRFSGVFDSTLGSKAYIDTDLPAYKDLENGVATLEIVAGGSGTLHYRWYKNGTMIEGQESSTCEVNSVGTYTVQVGNAYDTEDPTKIRWTDSDPCVIPEASELDFADMGNIAEYGYADGVTVLSVTIEKINDEFGRQTGEISYKWYRKPLDGETLDSGLDQEEVATTETYKPLEGEVGYYYVEAVNTHNGDTSNTLKSAECVMKVRAVTPTNVTIMYNDVTHLLSAEVEIPHKNDLWYEWHCEGGAHETAALGASTYKPKVAGDYYCRVYQHVYPGATANYESISEKKTSNFYTITEDDLK